MNRAHARLGRSERGFTLIELLAVLTVLSILTMIAVPTYNEFVVRSRRAEAKAALQAVALWMERNQAATFSYATTPSNGLIDNAFLSTLGWGQTPATGTAQYLITFAATPTSNSFTVIATPQGAQQSASSACGGPLAIDNLGRRGVWRDSALTTDSASQDCWNR